MIDRIAKFRAFKQKSLAIEMMFARSSSGASSLEHQTSFDDSSLNANRPSKKSSISPGSAARMGANVVNTIACGKKPTIAFRVPSLFSLINNNSMYHTSPRLSIIVNALVKPPQTSIVHHHHHHHHYYQPQQPQQQQQQRQTTSGSSSSGVSTLRSGRSSGGSTVIGWHQATGVNSINRSKNSTTSLGPMNRQSSITTNNTSILNQQTLSSPSIPFNSNFNIIYANAEIDSNKPAGVCQSLSSILFDTYMEFTDFCDLFKSFYIHMRKDLKDLYDRYAILVNSKDTDDLNVERTWQRQRRMWKHLIYSAEAEATSSCSVETQLTRNCLQDELKYINGLRQQLDATSNNKLTQSPHERYSALMFEMQNQVLIGNNTRLFYDLLTSNSISPYSVNCAADLLLMNYYSQINSTTTTTTTGSTNQSSATSSPAAAANNNSTNREFYAITLKQFREFVENEQAEKMSDEELENLIERHEPNPFYRYFYHYLFFLSHLERNRSI